MADQGDNEGAMWEYFDLEMAAASVDTGEANMTIEEILGASVTGEEIPEASVTDEERPGASTSAEETMEATAGGGARQETSGTGGERQEASDIGEETAGLGDMPPPPRPSGRKRKSSVQGDGRRQLPRHAPLIPPLTSTTSPFVPNTYTRSPPPNHWRLSPSPQPWTNITSHNFINANSGPTASNPRRPAPPQQPWTGTATYPNTAAYPGPPASSQRPQAASLEPWANTAPYPITAAYPRPATPNLSRQVALSSPLATMPQGFTMTKGSTPMTPNFTGPRPVSIHFEVRIRPHFAYEYFLAHVEAKPSTTVLQFEEEVKSKMANVRELDAVKHRLYYMELKVRCLSNGRLSHTARAIVILDRTEKEEKVWIDLMEHVISRTEQGDIVTVDALFQPHPN